ncbi:MAG: hypothetical protein ABI238_05150 [Terrimesophilobacter sp.]
MTTLLFVVFASLGVIFLWGLIAPRSQWYVLVSWSHRDQYATEPSGSAYLLHRVIAALGIATMVVSGILVYHSQENREPESPTPPTAAEKMWGSPAPVVVNRVISSVAEIPKNLVEQPILGFQRVMGQTRQPPYLFKLGTFSLAAATPDNGYIGVDPAPGLVALDTALLVVHVAGDPACFPHAAIVRETDESVSIAIYYGRATPKDGSNAEFASECNILSSGANVSTLVPIQLEKSLGARTVLTLQGDAIRGVPYLR